MSSPLYVTRPALAPLEEYTQYLEKIWESGVLTHNGPMVQQLEKELCTYLRVKNLVTLANGTLALQLAVRALNLTGEVITTPFTFIASASVLAWEYCRPVFVDIDPKTWDIDAEQIEARITPKTTAILPVHVFSRPCDVERIQQIADKHGLKVIYDAAHAMAVDLNGKSILRYGDISCVSFHATKLFNTAEGGACVSEDEAVAERVRRLRFFGFNQDKDIVDDGTNAKMNELCASLGLANLRYTERVRAARVEMYSYYQTILKEIPGITFQDFKPDEYNYSYMPVLFESEEALLKVVERLNADFIFPRRYFYPSLHSLEIFAPQEKLPVAERVARCILCLPLAYSTTTSDVERVCDHIRAALAG